jgi:DNA repair exonuclease SbcCD ATPase subunit
MIAEDAKHLVELIERMNQLKANVDQRVGFRTRQEELEEAARELEKRVVAVNSLAARGSGKPNVAARANAFLNHIDTVASNFNQAPSWIIDFNNNPFRNALRGLNAELDEHITNEWRVYTERSRHANTQVLDVLNGIPAFAQTVQKVRVLTARLEQSRRSRPTSEEDFQNFDDLVTQVDAAWSELGSDEVPPNVERFLRAAGGREGAPLDLLTDDVKEWLETRRIDTSFRIRMSSQIV